MSDYTVVPPAAPRRGMPVWGIVLLVLGGCGVGGIAVIAIVAAILFPVFASAREAARKASCQSNVKQMSLAVLMYAEDFDGRFPPKGTWADGADAFVSSPDVWFCPSATDRNPAYAFNARLSGFRSEKLTTPDETPLIFESSLGTRSASDLLESFAPRHRGIGHVGFADGSVRPLESPPTADAGM